MTVWPVFELLTTVPEGRADSVLTGVEGAGNCRLGRTCLGDGARRESSEQADCQKKLGHSRREMKIICFQH